MKTYRLLADSRQLKKKAGDTVELPPAAARYLVQAGILEEVVEIQPRELAEGEMAQAAEPPVAPRRKRGAED